MNPSTALATVLVDELVRTGVRHVVLCPGSRSAPLAYAVHAAAERGELALHVRVDERAAAFLALGIGLATGVPAGVVTTSGTAVANLHPAVLEADEGEVPLLLLTADRPSELRGTRANQTADQVRLFGGAVRWQHELGAPDRRAGQQAAWRTSIDRAVAAATGALGGVPGPVHLDVPLREPLGPDPQPDPAGGDAAAGWPEGLTGRSGGRPWTSVAADPAVATPVHDEPIHDSPEAIPDSPRTVVVVGHLAGDRDGAAFAEVLALARVRGWPVLAEPFGPGQREGVIPHGPLLATVDGFVRVHPPDRILVAGRLTLTRDLAGLLRTPEAEVGLLTRGQRWPDPGHVVAAVFPWTSVRAALDAVPEAATRAATAAPCTSGREWADAWRQAAGRVHAAVAPAIAASWPSGPAVADLLLSRLPPYATLFVGSSNPARDVDLARGERGPAVVANRGLAGIDGCVSTAGGLALARPGRPTYALVGDLTFLHDANGLLVGPHETRPDLTVVVVNDDGGGIFGTLEYGDPTRLDAPSAAATHERIFATPTGACLADLCAGFGVPHERIEEPEDLARGVAASPRGLRVLEVPIPRIARELSARLRLLAARAGQEGERGGAL